MITNPFIIYVNRIEIIYIIVNLVCVDHSNMQAQGTVNVY